MTTVRSTDIDPLVSVVITTHNRAHLLRRAIQSALEQHYNNLEIIVVDDASQDSTPDVVMSLPDGCVKYIRHDVNRGVSVARNRGISESQGVFISFLDDDDCWHAEKIAEQVKCLQNPKVGLVYCGALLVDKTGTVCARALVEKRGDVHSTLLFKNIIVSPSTVMVRRSLLDVVGMFDTSLNGTEDYDLWVRLSKVSSIDCVPDYLVYYTAFQRNSLGSAACIVGDYPHLYDKFLTYSYSSGLLRRRVLAYRLYEQGNAYAFLGNMANARQAYMRSVRMWPLNPKNWVGLGATMGGRKMWRAFETTKRFFNRSTRTLSSGYESVCVPGDSETQRHS